MTNIGVFTITIINLFWHMFQSHVSSVNTTRKSSARSMPGCLSLNSHGQTVCRRRPSPVGVKLVPIGRCLVLIFSVCGNSLCHEKDEERQRPLGALGTPKILREFAWLKRVT